MDNRNRLIYVAGKYSGPTHEAISANIEIAAQYAARIWEMGYTAICPHLNTRHFEIRCPNLTHADYLTGDKEILYRCDGLFMLPNWKESPGAGEEYQFAHDIGLPVFHTIDELEHAEW